MLNFMQLSLFDRSQWAAANKNKLMKTNLLLVSYLNCFSMCWMPSQTVQHHKQCSTLIVKSGLYSAGFSFDYYSLLFNLTCLLVFFVWFLVGFCGGGCPAAMVIRNCLAPLLPGLFTGNVYITWTSVENNSGTGGRCPNDLRIHGDVSLQQACEMVMDILRERDQGGFGDRNEYGSRIGGGIDVRY